MFEPGYGVDTVLGFKAAGAHHDTLDFAASDFSTIANVLRHTQNTAAGAVIHDPTGNGDTVRLAGVSKQDLATHRHDFTLHA